MTNARNLANLLGGSTTISIESLSADIPITEKFTTSTQLPVTGTIGEQAFVEETNRLYIWNGSGWYNIALINTNPNITSDHDSSYTLSYGTPLNISVDAVDPEGLNLNYSYYTSDSIGNVATITNDSSQFTITPSSDYSVEGTFGLVFRASDGVNLATSGTSNFTLANQAPSLSGNSASYILSDDGSTPIIINLTSVDPEGQPITYTATGDSGFNAIATVSNDSSVFTITPKSADSAVSGTGTLTFTASDGVKSTNAASSFSLTFVSVITDSKYTTLLATATGTSDNNNITDASTNSHSITVNGNTYVGTFSPYRSGGYSGLFDSTSVVQLSFGGSSDFEFGTGNFTIETWFKWNSSSKPDTTIFSNRITSTSFDTGAFFLAIRPGDATSGGIEFAFDCGAPRYRLYCVDSLTADNAFFDEGWHHYAAVRNGTSLKLFVDGQEVDEITLPANETNFGINSKDIGLGTNPGVSSPTGPDGEYRDLRIVKGVAITPPSGGPTEPLEAVSGTTLLLYNGVGYVKDKSTSDHSPIYGSTVPTITATSPYDYEEYSATDHGGSVYFDGATGNTLEIPHSTNVGAFGTNDFTVQLWYYTEAINNQDYLIDFRQYGANGDYLSIFKNGSNKIVVAEGGSNLITGTKDISVGQWFFITVHRDSGSLKLFVNGEQDGSTYSDSTNYVAGSSNNFIIGRNNGGASYLMQGYLSDIRVTHGSALDGTTVPTAPLSSSGAELHIKGTDASIIDKSQGANLKLEGNTTGSTTQVKFSNTKSMYFDGTGDRATATGVTDLGDDFTIECWVYVPSTASGNKGIVSSIDNVGNWGSNGYWSFGIYGGGPSLQIDGGSYSGASAFLPTNQWAHLAVTRTSNTVRYFINGTLDSTTFSNSLTLKNPSGIVIGSSPNNNYIYNYTGYIQDLRIANECKYTAADETANIPSAPLEG